MSGALFLDRDGIINELVYYPSHGEWESPRKIGDLKVHEDIYQPLIEAQRAGWLLFVITNQPSYAKGKTSLESLQEVQSSVMRQLSDKDVMITEAFVCYHHPTSTVPGYGVCDCRKPSPFFLREAARKYDLDLGNAWMVGDQDTDIETGHRAGTLTAVIPCERSASKRGKLEADLVCGDLAEFVAHINR